MNTKRPKKQNKILALEPLVLDALRASDEAKEDNFYLYGAVIQRLGIEIDIPLYKFLKGHKELGAPPFESVTRARRKLIAQYPHENLGGSEQIRKKRLGEEVKTYVEYSRL